MTTITTPKFAKAADMVKWLRYAMKMNCYQHVMVKATTTFADGHSVEHVNKSKRGGTIASNFSFMIGTMTGKMDHKSDSAFAIEIDQRGGVQISYEIADEPAVAEAV